MNYYISDYAYDFQNVLNTIQANDDPFPIIYLQGERVEGSYQLPPPRQNRQAKVFAQGSVIEGINGLDTIRPHESVRGMSVSLNAGNSVVNVMERWDWDNAIFTKGRNQLQMAGQYGSVISNCQFLHGKRAIHGVFALQPTLLDCKFQFQTVESVCFRTGVSDGTLLTAWGVNDEDDDQWFTNPTTTNSQSNRAHIKGCRFLGRTDQKAMVRVQGSDGVIIDNPVFEGAAADYCVYADSRNSTTVRDIEINRAHVEVSPGSKTNPEQGAKSIFYFRAFPKVNVDKMYSQVRFTKHFEMDDCKAIHLDRLNFMPWDAGVFDSDDKCQWYFNDPEAGVPNIAAAANWVQGLPNYVRVDKPDGVFFLGKKGGKYAARIGSDETSLRIAKNLVDVRGVKTVFIPAAANVIEK